MKNNTITITANDTTLNYAIRKPNTVREAHKKTETVSLFSSHTVKPSQQTEYFSAVCFEYGTIFARKALKTVNAKSWTQKIENMLYHGDTDAEDIEQEARLAICELFSFGLLKKPADIFEYGTYVYSRINKKLNSNRRITAVFPCGLYWTDENGEEHVISVGQADKKLSKVETSDIVQYVKGMLSDSLSDRIDIEKVLSVFSLHFLSGKTARETCDILGIQLRQFARYSDYIKTALQNPDFYEYLTDAINEQ